MKASETPRRYEPEGYKPSGRTEAEIREDIHLIPLQTLLSPNIPKEFKATLQLSWWEEIALQQRDADEKEAREENERRNQA